jgi:biotin-(acetyl-CoA carboxylase) ligase
VTYQYPGTIFFNRGIAGVITMTQGPVSAETGCPAWMVVAARLRLSGEMQTMPLEFRMENTSLEEEGAGFISRTRLLEACCRHFLVWLHKWEEDGFRPVHDMWSNRAEKYVDLRVADGRIAEWLGLDEGGVGLLKLDGDAVAVNLAESLQFFAIPDLQDRPVSRGTE